MASDSSNPIWPASPRAAIELLVTDQHGFPIAQVEQGQTFKLQAWAHDFEPGREAEVYAAFADVEFDPKLVSPTGEVNHGRTFVRGRSGTIGPGLLDEFGGFRDLENGPPMLSEQSHKGIRLFEVAMTADSIGRVVFSSNPADDLPAHQTVLAGITLTIDLLRELKFSSIPPGYVPPNGLVLSSVENPVQAADISYGEVTLEIVEPGSIAAAPLQNPTNPWDTTNDGFITAADLSVTVLALRCQHDRAEQGCDKLAGFYPDVDGDGQATRGDVLSVLNYQLEQLFAGPDAYVARMGQPLSISPTDGVLRNDFTVEEGVVTASLLQGPDGLTLSEDGSFTWDPPDGFEDDHVEFTYSANYGKRSTTGKAKIFVRDINEEQVIVSLRTVNSSGEPITEAVLGDEFFLEAYVEDTRPRPEGVFAGYIDVEFDSDVATVAGPIKFGSDFPNARHGTAVPGSLDEVGGLQQFDDYQVFGRKRLFSIPMTAENEGELILAPNMADTFPDHYMLLLGMDQPVPAEAIQFVPTSLNIIDKNRVPVAAPDQYIGQPGATLSVPAGGGLLANDHDPDRDALSVRIVDAPAHGTVTLEANGAFTYTPTSDFTGKDTFTYIANDGELDSAKTTVTIDVRSAEDAVVAIHLQVFNDEGQAVDQVTVGDKFELRVFVKDLRDVPEGVFAAYLDVFYDESLVSTLGEISFGETYNAGREVTYAPGLIDEAGAFTGTVRPIGGGEFLLFRQRFTATKVGEVMLSGNPADFLPAHDVLLYGRNAKVDPEDIDFGKAAFVNVPSAEISFASLSLRILAEGEPVLGAADAIVVEYEVTGQTLDVLINDSTAVSHITGVSSSLGNAVIAADGRSISYSAPQDFAGHDRFTYSIVDSSGSTEVVAIDVQVKSPFQNFARPTDTDSDGHVAPIDALYGVNELNRNGSRRLTDADAIGVGLSFYLDVNGDHFLAPLDVLIIINELNERSAANAEGEFVSLVFTSLIDSEDNVEDRNEAITEAAVQPALLSGFVFNEKADDHARRSSIQRRLSPAERYFASLANEVEPLLEDDPFEAHQE